MSQPTIKQVWDALVEEAKALDIFKDVRAMPINAVQNVKFLDNFPGIQMPACLVVFLGRSRKIEGSGDERTNNWNFILVDSDPAGEAWERNIERIQRIEDDVCDQVILGGEVIILGSCDTAAATTNPRFSVYQIALSTRQAAERE